MVGGRSADLRGELGPAGRAQFVGVELQPQAGGARGGENRSRLVDREHARLAEYVRELGEALRRDAGEHARDEQANVFGTSFTNLAVLLRNFVGAEPCRHEPHWEMLTQSSDHTQRLELVLGRKPVARFYFDGGDPMGRQPLESTDGQREELVLSASPEITHGGMDPATAPSDLHVVEPGSAKLLLLEPRPAENGVRVGGHESRSPQPPREVDACGTAI